MARERVRVSIMTKPSRRNSPRIEISGQGLGVYSRADLDRRARELALIDGRTEATDEDRARAAAEFQDQHLPDTQNEDLKTMQSMSRDPSDPMVNRGRQTPEYGNEDEKADVERLALEGVEEAQHDQMLESRANVDEPLRSRPRPKKRKR
jgi:hypothetical protein